MSNGAQKKEKEIPGTKNEMETKNQSTICTLKQGLPGGVWWSQKPGSSGFNGYSGTEGKIDIPRKAATLSQRVKRKKAPKWPKEMRGKFAFLGESFGRVGRGWGFETPGLPSLALAFKGALATGCWGPLDVILTQKQFLDAPKVPDKAEVKPHWRDTPKPGASGFLRIKHRLRWIHNPRF